MHANINNTSSAGIGHAVPPPHNTAHQVFWPSIETPIGVEALILIHVITMLISIPGNLITAMIIVNHRTLREEPAYLLICSVSCADFMVSLVAQPLNIHALVKLNSGGIAPVYELALYFTVWGFCGASAFGVVFVTVDRFLCIIYSMHYKRLLDKRRTAMMIVVQWVCGLAYGALPIIDIEKSALPTAVASVATLVFMVLSMSVIYVYIYKNIQRLNRTEQNKQSRAKKRQNNATVTIFFIVLAFIVSWFPYIITNLIISSERRSAPHPPVTDALYYWFLGCGCWNSALNVIIYGFKNTTLKREARKWFACKCNLAIDSTDTTKSQPGRGKRAATANKQSQHDSRMTTKNSLRLKHNSGLTIHSFVKAGIIRQAEKTISPRSPLNNNRTVPLNVPFSFVNLEFIANAIENKTEASIHQSATNDNRILPLNIPYSFVNSEYISESSENKMEASIPQPPPNNTTTVPPNVPYSNSEFIAPENKMEAQPPTHLLQQNVVPPNVPENNKLPEQPQQNAAHDNKKRTFNQPY